MSQLPFKTAPKPQTQLVGNETIGTLELPVYQGLTVNEALFVEEQTQSLPDLKTTMLSLAQLIVQDTQVSLLEAFSAVANLAAHPELNNLVLQKYPQQLFNLQDSFVKVSQLERPVFVTAMLRRLVPEWTVEDTSDGSKILPALVDEVYRFALREQRGGKPEEESPELGEADLGKSNKEPTAPQPTGAASSGSSSPTGPQTLDSTAKTSADSPSGSSTKRLKKVSA